MITRATLFVMFASFSTGCGLFAPVVGALPNDVSGEVVCEAAPTCDALFVPPVRPAHLAALRGPDDACGTAGRAPEVLSVTADTVIDADMLGCIDLTVEVVGEGSTPCVLTVEGEALGFARLHVRSARLPVELHLEVARVEQSEISVEGPVDVFLDDVDTVASRIVLESLAPLAAPSLSLDGGLMTDVEIRGARAEVHVENTQVRRVIAQVHAIVLDRARVQESGIQADVVEMLAAELTGSDLDVTHLVAAAGTLGTTHITRCSEVTLSQLTVVGSFIAACDSPIDARDVGFESTVIAGDVVGLRGSLRHSVFGGARLALPDGEVFASAFCGTTSVDAGEVVCVRCGSRAPADMCGTVSASAELCPGLCASTCSASGEPTMPAEECAS